MKGNSDCPKCGGHGVEEVLGGHNTVLEVECTWRDGAWKAHDLVAALRFHKHELSHQAADEIERQRSDLQRERAESERLRACFHVFAAADKDVTAAAFKSVAYDVVMNLITSSVAEHQLERRSNPDAMADRIALLENAISRIIEHWWEFGEMMLAKADTYGFDEKIDDGAKLVRPLRPHISHLDK